MDEIHRYALETITVITLDTRMGCLKEDMDPRIRKVMEGVQVGVKEMGNSMRVLPLYRISKHLSPTYKRMSDGFDLFGDYVREMTLAARERIFSEENGDKADAERSVMEKVIRRCGRESSVPSVLAFDMCIAGIDTTGNSIGFLLTRLSENPEEQVRICGLLSFCLPLTGNIFI